MNTKKSLCIGISFAITCTPGMAEVTTDGSVGPALQLPGPNFTIGQELGSLKGGNLFHSFNHFNLNNTETATFTGDAAINNVISRVTGGELSTIDGTLKSAIGHAAFYFINPAGIMFGPNAKVDVPGAFYASTAGELKFADGSSFNALHPEASSLSMAAPEAFGFLGKQSGNLSLKGTHLEFNPGATVQLSANQIAMNQGNITTIKPEDKTPVAGIDLQLLAVGDVTQDTQVNTLPEQALAGDITLIDTTLDASGNGTGRVAIRGGDMNALNTIVFADNSGSKAADKTLGVDIKSANLNLVNTLATSDATSTGDGGNVTVAVTDKLNLSRGASIHSFTNAGGNAGNVNVSAKDITINGQNAVRQTAISSEANSNSTGNAGNITLATETLSINGQNTGITSNSSNSISKGTAGNIVITASKNLSLTNGAKILSDTSSLGNAGGVTINQGAINITGEGSVISSSTRNSDSNANAGSILIATDKSLDLVNGGQIVSITNAQGSAGFVNVQAESIVINGQNASTNTGISTSAGGKAAGDAGGITIEANKISIDRQNSTKSVGFFSSTNNKASSSNAGMINVTAHKALDLTNGGSISASSVSAGQKPSIVKIIAPQGKVTITNGSGISTDASLASSAGDISINAESLYIDGQSKDTGVTSNASGNSNTQAGNVTINTSKELVLTTGGRVLSDTSSQGKAGEIVIQSDSLLIDGNQTLISSSTNSSNTAASAGSVTITASKNLDIKNGGSIQSRTIYNGDAGQITVNAETIELGDKNTNTSAIITSSAGDPEVNPKSTGNAGAVTLNATKSLSLFNGGQITSSTFTQGNHAGQVTVTTGTDKAFGNISILSNPNSQNFTGIASNANKLSTGNAGEVHVTSDQLTIAGPRSGITSNSNNSNSEGKAGNIVVKANAELNIKDGARILSETVSQGDAGNVKVDAGSINISGSNTGISTTAKTKDSKASAGSIDITATQNIAVENRGQIISILNSAGHGGTITVTANNGKLSINKESAVSANAYSGEKAGDITINAKEVIIDGQGYKTGISSTATGDSKTQAGNITVTANKQFELTEGGLILSDTASQGKAGDISVQSGSVVIDGKGKETKISSSSKSLNAEASAGSVTITANNLLDIKNSAQILSASEGAGMAGVVGIKAFNGDVSLTNGAEIVSGTKGTGSAGGVKVVANSLIIDGTGSVVTSSSLATVKNMEKKEYDFDKGNAGLVDISANSITLDHAGRINSTSETNGTAGDVSVGAGKLNILNGSQINTSALLKNAGNIEVAATDITIDGSATPNPDQVFTGIASQTLGEGKAGQVYLHDIRKLNLGNGGLISSATASNSKGEGGIVIIEAINGNISINNGGRVISDTNGQGNAGDVIVRGKQIIINGEGSEISSKSQKDSQGSVGLVSITASDSLAIQNRGSVNISSSSNSTNPKINEDFLFINSPIISIDSSPNAISSSATGNTYASDIYIKTNQLALRNNSRITSEALQGDSGYIFIDANDWVQLHNGFITTSASAYGGKFGNGGNININNYIINTNPKYPFIPSRPKEAAQHKGLLLLDTSLIQANTTADNGKGGAINLLFEEVLTSGTNLQKGGTKVDSVPLDSGQNVIQAAAANRLNDGIVNVNEPQLNIVGSLVGVATPELDLTRVGQEPCSSAARQSTLKSLGKGGVPMLHKGQDGYAIDQVLPPVPHAAAEPATIAQLQAPDCPSGSAEHAADPVLSQAQGGE